MNQKLTIHSKSDEIQAYHTERSADSLDLVNEKLDILNETIKKAEREKKEPVNINVKLEII